MSCLVKENKCFEISNKIQVLEVECGTTIGGLKPTQIQIDAPDGMTPEDAIAVPIAYTEESFGDAWYSIPKNGTISVDTNFYRYGEKSTITVNVYDNFNHINLRVRILLVKL